MCSFKCITYLHRSHTCMFYCIIIMIVLLNDREAIANILLPQQCYWPTDRIKVPADAEYFMMPRVQPFK